MEQFQIWLPCTLYPRPINTLAGKESRPIFITGVPRCGSSWVGEILGNCSGVRYVYEPLNLQWVPKLSGNLSHFKYLNAKSQGSPIVQQVAHNAFQGLQSRKQLLRALYRGYWRAATGSARRVVVKDPTAPLMAEWVAREFNARILVVVRHPCGFASSLEKLDWQVHAGLLLRQKILMRDHLESFEDVLRSAGNDKWLNRGVFWAAIHKVLSRQMADHPDWVGYKYEDLCSDPEKEYVALAQKLGLVLSCQISDKISADKIKVDKDPGSTSRNSSAMPDIWKERMSEGEVDSVMGMVREFGIDDYKI